MFDVGTPRSPSLTQRQELGRGRRAGANERTAVGHHFAVVEFHDRVNKSAHFKPKLMQTKKFNEKKNL